MKLMILRILLGLNHIWYQMSTPDIQLKNLKKLEDLLMLGYTPAQVARPYQLLALGLNLSVLACAVPVVVWVRSKYLPMVRMLGEDYAAPGIWGMLLAGILVVGAVVLIDMLVIRHKVNGLWTQR